MDREPLEPGRWRPRPRGQLIPISLVVVVTASALGVPLLVGAPTVPLGQGSSSGESGPIPVPVVPLASSPPLLTVYPLSGYVGTGLTFNASHFSASSTFTITNRTGVTICTGKTTSKGLFSCTYVLPPTSGGVAPFTGADTKGHSNTSYFRVLPELVVSPSEGPVGTPVHFAGTGFAASGTVDVNWTTPSGSRAVACQAPTDGSGNGTFACDFTVPAAPGGAHPFLAKGSGSALNATANFTVLSGLSVGPSFGPGGTPVTFDGNGFGSAVVVTVAWTAGTACSATSLDTGSFSCEFVIPNGTSGGTHVFTATDPKGNSANTSFVLTFLSVAPTSAPVGSSLNFTGGGFAPDSAVTLTWAGGAACPGSESSSAGLYSCLYTLPAATAGTYLFTATDASGDSATTSFTVVPALKLNVTYGDPGTPLTITGSGFGGALPVNVTWSPNGSTTTACTATTTSGGGFSCLFTVPASTPGGPHTFSAKDSASDTAVATFVVTYLTASPGSGPYKTTVTLAGGGFAPGAKFTLTWGSASLACGSGAVSSSGTVGCSVVTSYAPAGARPFEAHDADGDSATAPFTVTSHLSITPANATVGTTVAFALTGFAASKLVTVAWASNLSVVCSATASVLGAANCSLKLPAIPAGSYAVTASDPSSDVATGLLAVLPALEVSPSTGHGGAAVTFSGSGFAGNSSVTVSSSLGDACTTTTAANGTFSCAYTIPYAPSGTYEFTAVDASSHKASTSFGITPVLAVSVARGPVGTLVAFEGNGFGAGRVANVTWSAGLACSATVAASGAFSCSFAIPPTPTGAYTFTAEDLASGGNEATATFTVVPSLSVTPASGAVGTAVGFQGMGYPATTTVAVTWGEGEACSATTLANGTFTCGFALPAAVAGAHLFAGTASSGPVANATFTVLSALTATPSTGPVGTSVVLNGSGLPGSAYTNVTWSYGTVCSIPTSVEGSFSCAFVVPATPAGRYTLSATVSGTTLATASFVVAPSLAATPAGGPVGTTVAFGAAGFGASVAVTIAAAAFGTVCHGTTAANGTFRCGFAIPPTPSGTYRFTATDALSNEANATFTVGTTFTVSPTSGPVGTSLHFSAAGFAASSAMTVALAGSAVCVGTTNASGNFACTATMPVGVLGPHTFTATAGPSATTTFTVRPSVASTPSSGPVGTSVAFNGTGFPASTLVTVTWSGSSSCSATTNASGSFGCALVIPASTAGGSYLFTATDADHDSANATFSVVTGLSVVPAHGPAGTAVTLTGSNFAASVAYNVTFEASVLCSGTTNASGGFVCKTTVPPGAPGGAERFVAATATSNASALFTVTFLVASPPGVIVGSSVNLSGGGFVASAGYTVRTAWGTVCAGTTGPTGTFVCRATIPSSATPGAYTYTANDSSGDSAVAAFSVFSLSVPAPSPASVDVGQTVRFTDVALGGSGTLTYTWTASSGSLGCGSSTTATMSCTPTVAGSYTVTVYVTDGNGFASPAVTSATYTVYAPPTVTALTPTHASVDVGQTVSFTATESGGSGGFTYTWTAPGGLGCTLTRNATITCTAGTAGTYTLTVKVNDSNGVFSPTVSSGPFTVDVLPSANPPVANRTSLDTGESVNFTTTAVGGSGSYVFAWTAPAGLGCARSTTATLVCVPTAAGSFTVSVVATDSNGGVSPSATSHSVSVALGPTVSTPTASRSGTDTGQTVMFNATAAHGHGAIRFTWVTPAALGCTASTSASISCVPTAPGSYDVNVTVTDANGGTSAVSTLAAYPVSPKLVVTLTVSPTSVLAGHSVTFTGAVVGGSGSNVYTWANLPSGCSAPTGLTLTCSPTGSGSVVTTLTVTDANENSVTGNTTLNVRAAFLGLPALEGELLVTGAALAGLALVIVAVVLHVKKRRAGRPKFEF